MVVPEPIVGVATSRQADQSTSERKLSFSVGKFTVDISAREKNAPMRIYTPHIKTLAKILLCVFLAAILGLAAWSLLFTTEENQQKVDCGPEATTRPYQFGRFHTMKPPYGEPIVIQDLSEAYGLYTSPGRSAFEKCTFKNCYLNYDSRYMKDANIVIYSAGQEEFLDQLLPNQTIIYHQKESPLNLRLSSLPGKVDYIMSYRRDADFYAPYGLYRPFTKEYLAMWGWPQPFDAHGDKRAAFARNFVKMGTKNSTVLWYVSNCLTHNDRISYAQTLARYVDIDQFGACNNRPINRNDPYRLSETGFFYLAFENSDCKDYITEKFWVNALHHKLVPIVMGTSKEDYAAVAPPNSFIHVDDFSSPKELARHLIKVRNNPHLYNQYHMWRMSGRVQSSEEIMLCALCETFGLGLHKHRKAWNITEFLKPEAQCAPSKGLFAKGKKMNRTSEWIRN